MGAAEAKARVIDEGVDDIAVNVDVLKTWGGAKRRVERRGEVRGDGRGGEGTKGMVEWEGGVSTWSGWGERRAERIASEVEAMEWIE